MEFHKDANGRYLPLLPRGDPNKPRGQPRYSVVDMPKEDVRKQRQVMMDEGGRGKQSNSHLGMVF